MRRPHRPAAPIIALLGFLLAGPARPALADTCIEDWGAAGEIVRAEGLLTMEDLSSGQQAVRGTIVKATLCRAEGGYHYRLVVRTKGGQMETLTLNAAKPSRKAHSP